MTGGPIFVFFMRKSGHKGWIIHLNGIINLEHAKELHMAQYERLSNTWPPHQMDQS